MSPPHAKPRLIDQPVTHATELPTMSLQSDDPGSPTAGDIQWALEAQKVPSKKKKVQSISKFYYFHVEKLIINVFSEYYLCAMHTLPNSSNDFYQPN